MFRLPVLYIFSGTKQLVGCLLTQSNVLGEASAHQALFETDVQKHRRSTGIIGIDMQCCL